VVFFVTFQPCQAFNRYKVRRKAGMGRWPVLVATEEDLHDQVGSEDSSCLDEPTFESLFLKNYNRVVLILFRLVGDRGRAEELANDVFWKLYQQPFSSGREHNLGGWLYRTAVHMGMDFLRADARRKRYEQIAGQSAAESDTLTDPLDQVFRSERRKQVREILARLKPAQAQILILRSSGLSYKELAQILGVGTGSIGTLLSRAEAEFEKRYRELYGGEK
jgi:RNA polymerase sigma factor (sigma-70 family)